MSAANTQTAMHVCASEEAQRVDAELNDTYRMLLSVAGRRPAAVEKIEIAERAWITYRDAYIEAMYPAEDKLAEYGSIFLTEANLLRSQLTRQQIVALKDLLKQHRGSK